MQLSDVTFGCSGLIAEESLFTEAPLLSLLCSFTLSAVLLIPWFLDYYKTSVDSEVRYLQPLPPYIIKSDITLIISLQDFSP